MAFEKFVPPRRNAPPRVSIKRTGTITFDLATAAHFGLDGATHVTLYFDAVRKFVGVRRAEPREEGALRLSHRKRVCSVRAKAFFETFRLSLERTARYPVSFDAGAAMAVIELTEVRRRPGRHPRP
ncbi:MAG: hypothetical protein ACOY3Y_13945 [Acidobacteriota bacterium]